MYGGRDDPPWVAHKAHSGLAWTTRDGTPKGSHGNFSPDTNGSIQPMDLPDSDAASRYTSTTSATSGDWPALPKKPPNELGSNGTSILNAAVKHGEHPPLDRYAKTFIPQWLKDVNADPNFVYEPLPDSEAGGPLDYTKYALNVWPLPLWERLQAGQLAQEEEEDIGGAGVEAWLPEGGKGQGDTLEAEGEETTDGDESIPMNSQTADSQLSEAPDNKPAEFIQFRRTLIPNLPLLTQKSYNLHWTPLLEEEAKCRMAELSSHTLYAQLLTRYQPQGSTQTAALFTISLPGIREERPQLYPGDRLFLRPLATPSTVQPRQYAGWLHVVFEARIRAVRTLQGEIVIECPQIESWIHRGLLNLNLSKFNISFGFNRRAFDEIGGALNALGRKLYANSQTLRKWLSPTTEDAEEEVKRVSGVTTLSTWHDDGLNPEQKAAVTSIALHDRRIPFLLSGPPGTGKTNTCVEAVLQILRRDKRNKVLLVAPSNAASDVLALRLAKHLGPKEMYRINDSTRTFAEVPDALGPYTYVDEERNVFSLPPWQDLMRARVVVTACHDVPMLVRSRVASNSDLGQLQKHLLPGLNQDPDTVITLHWTHLLIDEAGQATEPDLAPALWCVLPHPLCRQVPCIVLVGDVKQLGPAIRSDICRSHELDVSLLERLIRRPAYASALASLHKLGRDIVASRGQGRAPISADFVNCGHLLRNYRARHPALLHLPSNLFYGDSLVPSSIPTPRSIGILSWTSLPKRGTISGQPLLFIDNDSPEEWVDEGVSWWNDGEARTIVRICQDLLNQPYALSQEDISVISPFREQVWKIRLMLRSVDLGGVRVGPVEAFQGQESSVVIISPVRSRRRFIQRDRETSSGLIFESKRLNVAITRARELMIIVGNAETLSVCEEWRRIIGHAQRNGWLVRRKVVQKVDDMDAQQISALEYAEKTGNGWWSLMLAQAQVGQSGDEDSDKDNDRDRETSLLAGRMATVAMLADEDDD